MCVLPVEVDHVHIHAAYFKHFSYIPMPKIVTNRVEFRRVNIWILNGSSKISYIAIMEKRVLNFRMLHQK